MRYKTEGVCSPYIDFSVVDGKVTNVQFTDGCKGSHTGLSLLVEGMEVDEVISKFSGIACGGMGSSCPAQLAQALIKYKEGTL